MSAHIASVRMYVLIFAALIALTLATVGVTYIDLGEANLIVAMGIAITKATLVLLFFMHLRWSNPLIKTTVVTAFAFLAILGAFTFADYLTRGLLGVSGR